MEVLVLSIIVQNWTAVPHLVLLLRTGIAPLAVVAAPDADAKSSSLSPVFNKIGSFAEIVLLFLS